MMILITVYNTIFVASHGSLYTACTTCNIFVLFAFALEDARVVSTETLYIAVAN